MSMFKRLITVSTDATSRDKEVNRLINKKNKKNKGVLKILLLGAGESGKTTVFKQMCMLQGQGFDDDYYRNMKSKLCGNIVDGTWNVLTSARKRQVTFEDPKVKEAAERVIAQRDLYFNEKREEVTEDTVIKVEKKVQNDSIDEKLAADLRTLWASEQYRETYRIASREGKTDLPDSYPILLDKLCEAYPTWGGPTWTPDKRDILLARVRTSGMAEEVFKIKAIKVKLIDVGGQRSERKKWMHMFTGIHSIIYVVSMSEYDQTLFEDSTVWRIEESINLFKELAEKEYLQKAALVLFLNKFDLFLEKYVNRKIPLNYSEKFPDAPKVEDEEDEEQCDLACEWYRDQFLDSLDKKFKRTVYTHVTTALDNDKMAFVLNASTRHILEINIKEAGLMG